MSVHSGFADLGPEISRDYSGEIGRYDSTPPLAHSSVSGSRDTSPSRTPIPPLDPRTLGQLTPGALAHSPWLKTNLDPGVYHSHASLSTPDGKHYLSPDEVSDGKVHFGEDENKDRGNWSGKLDFLLSCLGYAVGLGNVWRFPYLCYRNGGGAFFIPYIIMLVFVGVPLFFMELSLGQFSSNGPLTCWGFAPLFRGIGVAQLIVSGLVAIYYNMIIAWSIYYLFSSLINAGGLPWEDCTNEWNTPQCTYNLPDVSCDRVGDIQFSNGTCYNRTGLVGVWNYSVYQNETGLARQTPSSEYYERRVLNLSDKFEVSSVMSWEIVLSLMAAWIIAFFCMIKGIKSTGKVVYFTALFPYAVLLILFGRGVSLPNAVEGIIYYVRPDWDRLADARVWNDAAVQIFFSLSNCWGGLIALSSYNRFHNNTLRDTIIVSAGNCLTSIFAGFVIFSFLGFMAGEMNTTVDKVADKGSGLAFIVYPDAVTRMPVSPLWAVLFFCMLLTLGLDSQFAMLETVLTSLLDQFKQLRPHKTKVILVMSIIFFCLGLPLCTRSGAYLLQLMDTYCGGWAILVIGLCECIGLAWVYGADRFMEDIRVMNGKKPSLWWRLCWQGFSPLLIIFILFYAWIDYSPAHYGDYYFPAWADGMGWLMSLCSVIWIPICAVFLLCREDGGFIERVRNLCLPTEEWGPALVKHRRLVDYVHGWVVDPWAKPTKTEQLGMDNPAMKFNRGQFGLSVNEEKPVYGTPTPSFIKYDESKDSAGATFAYMPRGSRDNLAFLPNGNGSQPSMSRSRSQFSVASAGTAQSMVSYESMV